MSHSPARPDRTGNADSGVRRVLLSGVFDMKNFGDLLFPLLAAERLGALGVEVIPVAPTGAGGGLPDALVSISMAEMLGGETPADGVVIGGGYLIHTHRMAFLEDYKEDDVLDWAGPSLWLGTTLAAAVHDIPIAWNAPGAPHPLASSQVPMAQAAMRAADYLSVRDEAAVAFLQPPADVEVAVVPDPVAELARLWPRRGLDAPFKTLLARKQCGTERPFVAIHLRNRSLAGVPHETAAAWIDAFTRAENLTAILVAVGRSHEDDVLARSVSGSMRAPHLLLDDPVSLLEVAAAIGCSRLYLGASLHGYIAAAAYDVPGVLVARPNYGKFAGFLEHTGRLQDLAGTWPEAFERGSQWLEQRPTGLVPDHVLASLDRHWERIAAALDQPARRRAQRQAFLGAWLRAGVELGGVAWTQRPFLRRPQRPAAAGAPRRTCD